ncbi:MAG: deoxyribonuclease HsdR [Flavobacteriales bacterium]|nr:MAG: deoxyribonuclease HsdR [Flavobacteriales bacterium]
MKKFVGLMLAATLGGIVSTGVYKYFEEKKITAELPQKTIQQNVKLVNYPKVAPETLTDFSYAAELSVNAVVHVKTSVNMEYSDYYYFDPFREFFFGEKAQPKKHYQPQRASGSGVIISTDGFIVTNNHVIRDAEKVEVTLNDKKTYKAEVIGTDPTTDIALLKIDGQNLPYIPYGNSDDVRVGEWVLAVGNPFNLTSTVTAGIVSAKGRDINILQNGPEGISAVESFIQTDAAVNPGNSGGALVSTTGNLIGINTAIKSNTGSYTGYSFAIPVNIVKKVVNDLLEYGEVQRAFIGVSIRNIDEELAEEKGFDELNGVYVAGIMKDGAAREAGIETGDIITKVGNVDVDNVPELQEQLSKFRPGDDVLISVKKDGIEKEILLTLKNKFGNTELVKKEHPKSSSTLGAEFASLTSEEIRKLRIKNGIKIKKLNGGKLRSAGIKEGFIITKVDKKPISNFSQLVEALENKKGGVLIEGVYPNGMKAYYGFGM